MHEHDQDMNETTPTKVLRRSSRDGVLGGVSVGLGRYLGIDPVIVRIVFIASLFAGGIGVVAYIAAWLLVPDEDGKTAFRPRRLGSSDDLTRVIGIVLVFFAATLVVGHWSWAGDIIFPLMLVAAGVWLLLRRGGTDNGAADAVDLPAADATLGGSDDAGAMPYTTTIAPPPAPPVTRSEPTGPPVTQITIAVLALVAGALGLAASAFDGLTLETALVVCLAVTGVGLVVGAFVGRGRPLIAVGIVLLGALSVTSAVDLDFRGGVGERRYTPVSIQQVADDYRLGLGEMVIDLRMLDAEALRGERVPIDASISVGSLEIIVPDGVEVVGGARAAVGDISAFGVADEGNRPEVTVERDGPEGAGTIVINAYVGAGEIQIR